MPGTSDNSPSSGHSPGLVQEFPAGKDVKNHAYRDDIPLYNSSITRTYLKLVRRRYPHVDVGDVLRTAGIEAFQVEDEGHWFTQRQVNRFQQRLKELTGNNNIAREAGRYSASPEALGRISKYILGLGNPARAYELAGKYSSKFSKAARHQARRIGPNTVEITVTPLPGVKEELFQCENKIGYMESIARLFDTALPNVEHPECLFRGDRQCRYVITWKTTALATWRRLRNLSLPLLFIAFVSSFFVFTPLTVFTVVAPLLSAPIFFMTWLSAYLESSELRRAVTQLENSSDELIDQIHLNYKNALMVNEIGQVLARGSSTAGALAAVAGIFEERLDFNLGLLLLPDADQTRLTVNSGYGWPPEILPDMVAAPGFDLGPDQPQGIFRECFFGRKTRLVGDVDTIRETHPQDFVFLHGLGIKSLLCCPMDHEDKTLGIVALCNGTAERNVTQREANLLAGIASQIALAVHERKLFNELERRVEVRTSDLARTNARLEEEILERKSVEQTKEKLIGELQEALAKVSTLSGLLPICASCKKIRDDKGYWNQLETYITDHSKAEFTHGMCPDCVTINYPGITFPRKPREKSSLSSQGER